MPPLQGAGSGAVAHGSGGMVVIGAAESVSPSTLLRKLSRTSPSVSFPSSASVSQAPSAYSSAVSSLASTPATSPGLGSFMSKKRNRATTAAAAAAAAAVAGGKPPLASMDGGAGNPSAASVMAPGEPNVQLILALNKLAAVQSQQAYQADLSQQQSAELAAMMHPLHINNSSSSASAAAAAAVAAHQQQQLQQLQHQQQQQRIHAQHAHLTNMLQLVQQHQQEALQRQAQQQQQHPQHPQLQHQQLQLHGHTRSYTVPSVGGVASSFAMQQQPASHDFDSSLPALPTAGQQQPHQPQMHSHSAGVSPQVGSFRSFKASAIAASHRSSGGVRSGAGGLRGSRHSHSVPVSPQVGPFSASSGASTPGAGADSGDEHSQQGEENHQHAHPHQLQRPRSAQGLEMPPESANEVVAPGHDASQSQSYAPLSVLSPPKSPAASYSLPLSPSMGPFQSNVAAPLHTIESEDSSRCGSSMGQCAPSVHQHRRSVSDGVVAAAAAAAAAGAADGSNMDSSAPLPHSRSYTHLMEENQLDMSKLRDGGMAGVVVGAGAIASAGTADLALGGGAVSASQSADLYAMFVADAPAPAPESAPAADPSTVIAAAAVATDAPAQKRSRTSVDHGRAFTEPTLSRRLDPAAAAAADAAVPSTASVVSTLRSLSGLSPAELDAMRAHLHTLLGANQDALRSAAVGAAPEVQTQALTTATAAATASVDPAASSDLLTEGAKLSQQLDILDSVANIMRTTQQQQQQQQLQEAQLQQAYSHPHPQLQGPAPWMWSSPAPLPPHAQPDQGQGQSGRVAMEDA